LTARAVPASAATGRARSSATEKASPEQVGREAGLAIRLQLDQKQMARRDIALRRARSRAEVREVASRASAPSARSPQITETRVVSSIAIGHAPETNEAETRESEALTRIREENAEKLAAQWATERAAVNPRPADVEKSPEEAAGVQAAVRSGVEPAIQPVVGEPVAERNDSGAAAQDPAAQDSEAGDSSDRFAEMPHEEGMESDSAERAQAEAEQASLRIPRGMPAPLFGTLASLERQNARLDAEGLERIEDESDLAERIADKLLMPVPTSSALTVNQDLPLNHRYCRPWTARFLADLARAHEALFHRPLEVSSAVRTVQYQRQLMETNGNAAPAEGDVVSPHLTGATVDIAKKGLSRNEIAWMRRRLLALEDAGKIDVEEEFRQACFHITVYKTYAPARPAPPTRRTRRHIIPDANSVAAAVGQ